MQRVKQVPDLADGAVGFQSYQTVSAGELRDSMTVHPTAEGCVLQFSTELRYRVGAVQRSESSITLNPEQAATFAQAMSAPRLGGIAAQCRPLSDPEIIDVLASIGTDAEPSRFGFDTLQVHTTVPGVREIVAAYINKAGGVPTADQILATLPSVTYMDPPDGGDVSIAEQFMRMAADAELYRKLRGMHWNDKKLAVVEASDLKLGVRSYSGEFLDQAIERHAPGAK